MRLISTRLAIRATVQKNDEVVLSKTRLLHFVILINFLSTQLCRIESNRCLLVRRGMKIFRTITDIFNDF